MSEFPNNPKVDVLNEVAYTEVYGSTWVNEADGSIVASKVTPDKGVYRSIRESRGEDAADSYVSELNSLVDEGFEFCQAKIIVDKREEDRFRQKELVAKAIESKTHALEREHEGLSKVAAELNVPAPDPIDRAKIEQEAKDLVLSRQTRADELRKHLIKKYGIYSLVSYEGLRKQLRMKNFTQLDHDERSKTVVAEDGIAEEEPIATFIPKPDIESSNTKQAEEDNVKHEEEPEESVEENPTSASEEEGAEDSTPGSSEEEEEEVENRVPATRPIAALPVPELPPLPELPASHEAGETDDGDLEGRYSFEEAYNEAHALKTLTEVLALRERTFMGITHNKRGKRGLPHIRPGRRISELTLNSAQKAFEKVRQENHSKWITRKAQHDNLSFEEVERLEQEQNKELARFIAFDQADIMQKLAVPKHLVGIRQRWADYWHKQNVKAATTGSRRMAKIKKAAPFALLGVPAVAIGALASPVAGAALGVAGLGVAFKGAKSLARNRHIARVKYNVPGIGAVNGRVNEVLTQQRLRQALNLIDEESSPKVITGPFVEGVERQVNFNRLIVPSALLSYVGGVAASYLVF